LKACLPPQWVASLQAVVTPIPVAPWGKPQGLLILQCERSAHPRRTGDGRSNVRESNQKDLAAIARLVLLTALLAVVAAVMLGLLSR